MVLIRGAFAFVCFSGCSLVTSVPDDSTERPSVGGGGSTTATTGGAGGDPCAECAPSAPFGFEGPFLLTAEGCGESATVLAGNLVSSLEAIPAECTCSCAPDSSGCAATVQVFNAAGCMGSPLMLELSGNCSALGANYDSAALQVAGDAFCVPDTAVTLPTLPPFVEATLCEASLMDREGCLGSCVTPEPDKVLCIASFSELTCPPAFPVDRSIFTEVVDERSCEPCTCDAAGLGCTGWLEAGLLSCDDLSTPPGGCEDPPFSFSLARVDVSVTGDCVSSIPMPVGEVMPEVTLVCCIE